MTSKLCTNCGETKLLSEFNRKTSTRDGLQRQCRACNKDYLSLWRKENTERCREYRRQPHAIESKKRWSKTPEGRLSAAKGMAKYIESNSEKKKARVLVHSAVLSGRIQKLPCVVCGDFQSEGHHADYSLPLAVTWLCKAHHEQLHKEHKDFLRK